MNLIGESFDDFVGTQVNLRQKFYGSSTTVLEGREQYLYNKQPFIKLVSSVNIEAAKLKKLGLPESLAGSSLAKSFVLFAGTSEFKGLNNDGQDQFSFKAGLNNDQSILGGSAYGLGGLEFGQVPMPGITSATVSYKNRGSLKTATINVKAYNTTQLNIIDALYLRLGYTVLLEWGWGANYLNNKGEVVPQIRRTLANEFLDGTLDSGNILPAITRSRRNLSGNYDALYGTITNFNWSFNPDGTYDITISLVSVGNIIESLTINDYIGKGNLLTSDDFQEVLDNVKNQLSNLPQNRSININGTQVPITVNFQSYGGSSYGGGEYVTITDNNGKLLGSGPSLTGRFTYEDEAISALITLNTGLVSQTEVTGSEIGVVGGNAGLNSLTYYLYKNIQLELDNPNKAIILSKRKGQIDSVLSVLKDGSTTYACRINWEGKSAVNDYIKFRTLLRWIQDNLIYDNVNGAKKSKAITFDLNVGDNLIYKNKYSVATDFTKVVTRNIGYPDLNTGENTSDTIDLLNLPPDVEFTSDKNLNAGKLMNVFLNLTWLVETLKSNVDDEGNISLFRFLQGICQGINSSLGHVNSLDVVVDEETNQIKFIDDKPIPGILESLNLRNSPTKFQVYAFSPNGGNLSGSFVRDFSIRTEITNKLATTLAVGAQALNAVVTENATALQSWNEGLTDRTAKIKQEATDAPKLASTEFGKFNEAGLNPTAYSKLTLSQQQALLQSVQQTLQPSSSQTALEKYKNEIVAFVTLLEKYDDKTLSVDDLSQLNNLNKNWQKFWSQTIAEAEQKASPNGVGFIPINLNLTMDGLSGMKIYQTFIIDSKFLPLNYPEKLQFLIKGISHTIDRNSWTTQIETFSIPKEITSNSSQGTPEPQTPDTTKTEGEIAFQIKEAKQKYEDKDSTRKPIKELTYSNNAIILIKRFEGLRLEAYKPTPKDRWTIGYGSTFYKNGKAVGQGDRLGSEKVATELLKVSLNKFENSLKTNLSTVKLNQNEFDALTAFTYNLGPKWSINSGLRDLLVSNNYTGAANKLLEYNTQDGEVLRGLTKRRKAERFLFTKI
jgi:GH24 family phage-related lysozyme (muramidase)